MNPVLQMVTFSAATAIVVATVFVTSLIGCSPSPEEIADGGDALAALRVDAISSRYDGRFWRIQYQQFPERYADAVAYCASEREAGRLGERPNCRPVLMADRFIREAARELHGPRPKGRGYTGILDEDVSTGMAAEEESEASSDREEQ